MASARRLEAFYRLHETVIRLHHLMGPDAVPGAGADAGAVAAWQAAISTANLAVQTETAAAAPPPSASRADRAEWDEALREMGLRR